MQESGGSSPRSGLDGVLDALLGPEASLEERVLVVGAGLGLALATLLTAGPWTTLQYAVGILVALDLGGGVVANATGSTQSWVHRDDRSPLRTYAFVAGHLHPIAISIVFPPIDPLYGGVVYGAVMLAGGLILWAPTRLKRPFALAAVTGLVVLDTVLVTMPDGLAWFVPVFGLKVLVGHLVPAGGTRS